jgi:hypothetical protein
MAEAISLDMGYARSRHLTDHWIAERQIEAE